MSSLNLANQDTAHYLYASLEYFPPPAVNEINKRFRAGATNITNEPDKLALAYDTTTNVFTLTCHNLVGHDLDGLLTRILRDYTASDNAESARFPECSFGDPFDDYDIGIEDDNDKPLPVQESLTAHVVVFDGINHCGKAQAFYLRNLPLAIRERANRRQNVSAIASAVSIRHVKWVEQTQEHVFNGRVGQLLPRLSASAEEDMQFLHELLAFTPFERLIDPPQPSPKAEPIQWEFDGDEPTVNQWLQGMGKTKQIDPGAKPEISKDAAKFTGGSTLQPGTGRLRVPKGASIAELQAKEEETAEPEKKEQQSSTFAALMESGSESESDSEKSSVSGGGSPPKKLKTNNIVAMQPTPDRAPVNDNKETASQLTHTATQTPDAGQAKQPTPATPVGSRQTSTTKASKVVSENRPPPTTRATVLTEESFPTYNRNYVQTDRYGLTGDAFNQAKWELENATPISGRTQTQRPRTFEDVKQQRIASAAVQQADGVSSLPHVVTSVTPMTYAETKLGGDEPWANNVLVPKINREGILINVDGSVVDTSRSQAAKIPPSEFPLLGSHARELAALQPRPNGSNTPGVVGTRATPSRAINLNSRFLPSPLASSPGGPTKRFPLVQPSTDLIDLTPAPSGGDDDQKKAQTNTVDEEDLYTASPPRRRPGVKASTGQQAVTSGQLPSLPNIPESMMSNVPGGAGANTMQSQTPVKKSRFAWSSSGQVSSRENVPPPRIAPPPGLGPPPGFAHTSGLTLPPGLAPPPGFAPPSDLAPLLGLPPPPGLVPLPGLAPLPSLVPPHGFGSSLFQAQPHGHAPPQGLAPPGFSLPIRTNENLPPLSQHSRRGMPDTSSKPTGTESKTQAGSDEALAERLRSRSPDQKLHYTMRQQAGGRKRVVKKPKAGNSKQVAKPVAILELPAPPPPPRSPPPPRTLKHVRDASFNTQTSMDTTFSFPEHVEPQMILPIEEAIHRLLSTASLRGQKAGLSVQFGLALLTDAGEMTKEKAMRFKEFQDTLDETPAKRYGAMFLSVLGRQRVDGAHLLRLPGTLTGGNSLLVNTETLVDAYMNPDDHGIDEQSLYEINIVTPSGSEWKVTFDQEVIENAEILPSEDDRKSIYVHYPLQVWDVRIQTQHRSKSHDSAPVPDNKLKQKIMHFLATLNTPEDAHKDHPAFEASIQDSAFGITSVFAKRVFTQAMDRGSWIVTQVWDLHVRSGGSVLAFAKPEQIMQNEGRLWWEAGMLYDGQEGLREVLNEAVEGLSGVGFVEEPRKKRAKKEPGDYKAFW